MHCWNNETCWASWKIDPNNQKVNQIIRYRRCLTSHIKSLWHHVLENLTLRWYIILRRNHKLICSPRLDHILNTQWLNSRDPKITMLLLPVKWFDSYPNIISEETGVTISFNNEASSEVINLNFCSMISYCGE